MMKATDEQLIRAFYAIHGKPARWISTKVVRWSDYTEEGDEIDRVGVAIFKDGRECWRATENELALDLAIKQWETEQCRGL